jgi:fructokinase
MGGGVTQTDGLLDRVRRELVALLAGYSEPPALDGYVTAPALGSRAGVLGAIALAEEAGAG